MNQRDLNALTKTTTWLPLSKGAYNQPYLSSTPLTIDGVHGLWVLKIPQAITIDDNLTNSSARAARKLRLINPEYPVFNIEGYRLTLTKDQSPDDDSIQPKVINVYHSSSNILMAAFIDELGIIQRTRLNDKLDLNITTHIIEAINANIKLSLETENLIVQSLGFLRECLILPYFGDITADYDDIAVEVISIYKRTRIIILDAEIRGNFLVHDQHSRCIDVDLAYRCDSPTSKLNKDDWVAAMFDNFDLDNKPTSYVLTLMYLDDNLPANSIEDKFLFPELIEKLQPFQEHDISIEVSTLNILLQIIELNRLHPIKDEYITPNLIKALEYYYARKVVISHNLINNIVHFGSYLTKVITEDNKTPSPQFDSYISQLSSESRYSFHKSAADNIEEPQPKRTRMEMEMETAPRPSKYY